MFNVLVAAAMLLPAAAVPGAAAELTGSIETVTVYRGQALVTRRIEADLPAGASDLVITDLPAQVLPDSLYAGGEGDVQIRAVQYRTRAVSQEPREEVRKIEQEMEAVQAKIRENQALQKLRGQKETFLGNLEKFTSAKATEETAKGALNFDTVKAMTQFLFEQRSTLSKEALDLEEQARVLAEQLSLLQRRRSEVASQWSRTAREAIVSVDKRGRGKARLRLSYLVGQSSWSPLYNLRCDGQGKQVALEYNALVQQMSEEDWAGVKLTLSTASPNMVSGAPILTPLWVTLTGGPGGPTAQPGAVWGGQRQAEQQLRVLMGQRGVRPGKAGPAAVEDDWGLNVWANKLQMLDFQAGRDVLLAGRMPEPMDEALSVNYELPGTITVPSRRDQQMIRIASLKLEGEFYYLAVPLLTPNVYQQADILNTSEYALLSGPVNSYMAGQFMGRGMLPMVAKGQRCTVGFGVDAQLRAGRELADKSDRIQGGNRELSFRYRLVLSNYKDQPADVRLLDRLPDPRGTDIRVTLTPPKDPLSEDKVYLRTIRQMGILRWEVRVPAKASGALARMVEYEFKMEFDRNMHVTEPSAQQLEKQKLEFKRDLERMMLSQ
ncbi:MAG: hypothetical protein AMJ81_03460 [Phycisphaerae bacterium SM23_33]|nr:MAG: hypothetical protein AMJ81_03460 [Phycisphaerae bacterium SM23_33]